MLLFMNLDIASQDILGPQVHLLLSRGWWY
jgi:hypothetical protein